MRHFSDPDSLFTTPSRWSRAGKERVGKIAKLLKASRANAYSTKKGKREALDTENLFMPMFKKVAELYGLDAHHPILEGILRCTTQRGKVKEGFSDLSLGETANLIDAILLVELKSGIWYVVVQEGASLRHH